MGSVTVAIIDGDGNRASTTVDYTVTADVDRILRDGEHFPDGFTIPEGETWAFPADTSTSVTTGASVIVQGTLRMRPSSPDVEHLLTFVGIDESKFVGGGHDFMPSDVGLWVLGHGVLDLQGHERERWNRTGTSDTWLEGDEIMAAPVKPGDYTFRRHTPGSPVPSVVADDGQAQYGEVFNLTSNVRIEGQPGRRAHLMFLAHRPQTIRHVGLRWMGPRRKLDIGSEPVLGRYPLHFHHLDNDTRGSLIEGVVVRDSSRAFVAHGSSGITFRDCVAHNITDDAYWWDEEHPTNDLTWDHCAAFGVTTDPATRGLTTGFLFGIGTGNRARDCVAAVVRGNKTANGFHWPEFANLHPANVWDEATGLVAHNNPGHGVYVWQNDKNPHHIDTLTAYSNGGCGLVHGAYVNHYRYRGLRLWGNALGDLRHQAASKPTGGAAQTWSDILAPVLVVGEHAKIATIDNSHTTVLENLRCRHVVIDEKVSQPSNPFGSGTYELRTAPGWPLTPVDFTIKFRVSLVTVVNADGSRFTVP